MKILLVTGIMDVPIVEGTQKSVLNLANELVDRGHEVAWLSNDFPERPDSLHKDVELVEETIKPSNYFGLRSASKEYDVVNVHTSSPRMSFFWRLISPRKSVTTWAARRNWSFREELMQYLSYNTAVTETVSEEIPLVKSITPYSVDTEEYCDRGGEEEKPVFMYIGKPSPRRGFDHVCEVLTRIDEDFVFRYAVAKERGDAEVARRKLEEYGLEEQTDVHYGYIDDLPEYLSEADIFFNLVENSLRITSPPILTLEAMACERVTFSADVEDFWDVIENGENGYRFSYDDYDEMVAKAEELIRKSGVMESIGSSARETIKEMFSIENSADRFERLYERRV